MSKKLWDGRFQETTDKAVEIFTSSIEVDKRLYQYDIKGSVAHCKMLAKQSIISDVEADLMIQGLYKIEQDIQNGNFVYDDSLEDIHMHIENRLQNDIGKVASKLHTARSRNDQVALDVKMYLKEALKNIISLLYDFQLVLTEYAHKNIDVILPGYTHLQRAQPVLFSHHIMAYYEMFKRDRQRFTDCLKRVDVMPLGAAALAGTTYPIDREYTAKLLDFSQVSKNSIDTVSDRDFIMEFLSCASICMIHFSRISEEFILWSSSEFNFIDISDGFTTGSSIMPQKKNPDVCELVRGKTGSVIGNLIAVITTMKSLPLAYNRDMQEDKKPLFETVDTLFSCIDIYIKMVPNVMVNKKVMARAVETGFLNATDMADYLAKKGMPFREAHGVAGKAVAYALEKKCELHHLSLKEIKLLSDLFDSDIFDFLTTEKMIERRVSTGGTSKKNVIVAIENAKKELKLGELKLFLDCQKNDRGCCEA